MSVSGRKAVQHQSSVYRGSAPDYEHSCDACLIEGQDVEACGYCVDCQDYLCVTCLRSHRKSRASRQHTLVNNTTSLPADVTKSLAETCTEKCAVHGSEILKFFCPNHEALACQDCVTLDHRTCDIDYIPKLCVGVSKSEEYRDTSNKLNDLFEEVNSIQKMANKKGCEVENTHKRIVDEINKFKQDVAERIDQLRCQIIREVVSEKDKQKYTVGAVLKLCEKITSDIKQVKTSMHGNEDVLRDSQVYVAMKRAEQVIKSQEIEDAKASLEAVVSELTFESSREMENILLGEIAFGTLTVPRAPPPVPIRPLLRGVHSFPADKTLASGLPKLSATKVKPDPLSTEEWYHGVINRYDTNKRLNAIGEDGSFLVRKSIQGDASQPYSLAVLYNGYIYNIKIRKGNDGKMVLGEVKEDYRKEKFEDVPELIRHYKNSHVILANAMDGKHYSTTLNQHAVNTTSTR